MPAGLQAPGARVRQAERTPGLTIGALAERGGVGVETIRFYQRRGLMDQPARPLGGTRRYDAAALSRLRFIRTAQAAGFALDDIAELLRLDATADRARARAIARDRLASLDARIAELEAARAWLRRLEAECGAGSAGPCPILSAFEG